MPKILWVGDPHVQKSNLDESRRLFEWVVAQHKQHAAHVILAGDLYNDFSLMRVEVAEFWHEFLTKLGAAYVITGNHDMTPDGAGSALTVHSGQCRLIDKPVGPFLIGGNMGPVGFVPFMRDNEKFLAACQDLYLAGCRTIFCHADINGAQYENGFYSPSGVDISGLPQDLKLISGHIHKQQEFGNVWFPGTPRHLTRSDVGETKGIWLLDGDKRTFIPTPEDVCVPFREYVITPETEHLTAELPHSDRVYVDVRGPRDFVSKTLKRIPETNRVRTFPQDEAKPAEIRESDGIPMAFLKFAAKWASSKGMTPEAAQVVLARVYEKCPSLKIG